MKAKKLVTMGQVKDKEETTLDQSNPLLSMKLTCTTANYSTTYIATS